MSTLVPDAHRITPAGEARLVLSALADGRSHASGAALCGYATRCGARPPDGVSVAQWAHIAAEVVG